MMAKPEVDLSYNHDELAREGYVLSLKQHINVDLSKGLRTVYDTKVVPAIAKREGRPPKNRHEIRRQMLQEGYFQMWGSLWGTSQNLMWENAGVSLDWQQPTVNKRSRVKKPKYGSLRTDPNFKAPRYATVVDIHGQPGGFDMDLSDDDVSAGFDRDKVFDAYIPWPSGDGVWYACGAQK